MKFTTTETVTLKGAGLFVVNKEVVNEVTIEGTGKEQYVAVKPTTDEIAFSYSVGDVQCKSLTKNFTAKTIYNLGTLVIPYLYLVPGEFWKSANARFAAYFYNDSVTPKLETWVDMTVTNGVYRVTIPNGNYKNVIFCRMNPDNKTNAWAQVWNQTADLDINYGKYYHVVGWSDLQQWSDSKTRPNISTTISGKYVFMKPSNNWKEANARFAVYSYDSSGSEWDNMEKVNDDLYYVSVSDIKAKVGKNNLIFCRMNPNNSNNGWNNDEKWNQTGDLSISSGKNYYTISGWGGGSWSNYTAF